MQNIPLDKIVQKFKENGFEVTGLAEDGGLDETAESAENRAEEKQNVPEEATDDEEGKAHRLELLKSYVARLSDGESLEDVRADFVKNFRDVDAAEIAMAEQTLIQAGTPIDRVQKLCDVHSALFHGATKEEKIANAEKQVQEALKNRKPAPLHRQDGGDTEYQRLQQVEGHPLQIFHLENLAIQKQIILLRQAVKEQKNVQEELDKTRQVAVHYAKKGDLIYPVLKTVYGFSGPSDVMWGVDDEIRDELKNLSREAVSDPGKVSDADWQERLEAVLTRAEEMIYKEENILFPLCVKKFDPEEWRKIARDHQDYEFCMIDPIPVWKEALPVESVEEAQKAGKADAGTADAFGKTAGNAAGQTSDADNMSKLLTFMKAQGMLAEEAPASDGEIRLPSGHMTVAQLDAVLNTIPLEITFIDENDINRYFNQNKEQKLFKRPLAALDREVTSCHPPKVQPIVKGVISDLKSGKRDSVDVWGERGGQPVLIRYMAVRDKEGKYVGTMECVQHMGFAEKHFKAQK